MALNKSRPSHAKLKTTPEQTCSSQNTIASKLIKSNPSNIIYTFMGVVRCETGALVRAAKGRESVIFISRVLIGVVYRLERHSMPVRLNREH